MPAAQGTGLGAIERADVAAVCVAEVENPKAHDVVMQLWADKKQPAGDVAAIFDGLKQGGTH